MVLPAMRQQPHVSFTQIDQYLRCPLKYKFTYVDRATPDFVPAALAFGVGELVLQRTAQVLIDLREADMRLLTQCG